VRLVDFCPVCGHDCRVLRVKEEARRYVREAAAAIIQAKGSTYYAIAQAVSVLIRAIVHDERRVLPVSTVHEEFRGVRDTAFSLPTLIGAGGAEQVLEGSGFGGRFGRPSSCWLRWPQPGPPRRLCARPPPMPWARSTSREPRPRGICPPAPVAGSIQPRAPAYWAVYQTLPSGDGATSWGWDPEGAGVRPAARTGPERPGRDGGPGWPAS
jgi:hypothetical protein